MTDTYGHRASRSAWIRTELTPRLSVMGFETPTNKHSHLSVICFRTIMMTQGHAEPLTLSNLDAQATSLGTPCRETRPSDGLAKNIQEFIGGRTIQEQWMPETFTEAVPLPVSLFTKTVPSALSGKAFYLAVRLL